jgi:DNA repair exonuclease SbcCD ATPase subunit
MNDDAPLPVNPGQAGGDGDPLKPEPAGLEPSVTADAETAYDFDLADLRRELSALVDAPAANDASGELVRLKQEIEGLREERLTLLQANHSLRERSVPGADVTEAGRIPELEGRIHDLQEALLHREREARELQEKLDTEAARSYRLAHRRIPALNREIENAQQQLRELQRRLAKAELRAETEQTRANELEAALKQQGAKRPVQLADEEELKLLRARVEVLDQERAQLADALAQGAREHREAVAGWLARIERLEAGTQARASETFTLRARLRALRGRLERVHELTRELTELAPGAPAALIEGIARLCDAPAEGEDQGE